MYPMKMIPAFKDYLWGGERLAADYGKQTGLRPLAESWELSSHPDGESVIENGPFAEKTLAAALRENPEWIGGGRKSLPVLIKLIDAKQKLSLQVHPSTGPEPKNEMWLVLDALPGSELILGLKKPLSRQELELAVAGGGILDLARRVPVKRGDCYLVPAGMIHAIGAGLLIAEVQQCSNITYRVNDYGRVGPDGKTRELHIREAVEAADTSLVSANSADNLALPHGGYTETILADWRYFSSSLLQIKSEARLFAGQDSAHCLLAASGTAVVRSAGCEVTLRPLETAFIPAGTGDYAIAGECGVLFTRF